MKIKHSARTTKRPIKQMTRRASRYASTCLGVTQVLVRLEPKQYSFGSPIRPIGIVSQFLRLRVR